MTPTSLPPALRPWAEALAALDPALAAAVGPMVQRLDHLVSRTETTHPDHGAVDGYGGLTVRGNIDRVLISEWALADELPLEFLRRIAASELLYLSPSYRSDQGRGRIAVLLDTGPDQLGPGRLVQLAGLIVFHRRAEARGTELLIGVLGDEPGAWRTGPFTAQLAGWLSARRNHRAVAGEAEAWSTGLEHPDECWLFSGPEPISPCATRHTIVTRICGWTEAGANAVEVVIDGDRTEFALPRSDEAVRALRGSLLRADPSVAAGAVLRDLHFPSTAPWLLARTATSAELASIRLDPGAVEPARRQRHALPGAVLAASYVGRRLVALVLEDDQLHLVVKGRRLRPAEGLVVAPYQLESEPKELAAAAEEGLGRLLLTGSRFLVTVNGRWWSLGADYPPERISNLVAVGPTDRPDIVQAIWRSVRGQVWRGSGWLPERITAARLGPGGSLAWQTVSGAWHMDGVDAPIQVGDERVLGLCQLPDGLALVTLSAGGLIVRLRRANWQRTLTQWSGAEACPAVHPTLPWLAVLRPDGGVEVGDLATGSTIVTIPSPG